MSVKILPDGREVPADHQWIWEWPEFKAFAKRLGIDVDKRWRLIVIRIPYDDAVLVMQEFIGND